ncbi:YgaP-like transmembrane domain [Hymenobacter elongatus]|uniref:YgaP-like transmembrane domain n=1 Tax=Hymenobacter elongatus TaxID=877208 RepID=UPI0014367AAA|nr:YgaP-like transmembrane domain [Hymenobacter elongatus]
MNRFRTGITYAYRRNIGWQDRTIRTLLGVGATAGAVYFFQRNTPAALVLALFALAQFGTVFSARCIICYFAGQCTIDRREKSRLHAQGVPYETQPA